MNEIRIYPDPILLKKAEKVQNIDGQIKEIVDRMTTIMHARGGIGLAAPQIGISNQIIILGLGENCRAFINPELISGEGESILEEGCLSLPAIEVPVRRKDKIIIQAWDLEGREVNLEVSALLSRVFQHEIDHLRGILIVDHLSAFKRNLLIKKMIKDQKRSQKKSLAL